MYSNIYRPHEGAHDNAFDALLLLCSSLMRAEGETFHTMKHQHQRQDNSGHFKRIEYVLCRCIVPRLRIQIVQSLLLI